MLCLSRKSGEKIIVGDDIAIVVNRVAGNRVVLGIEAPEHIKIIRGELDFDDERSNPQKPPGKAA